MIIFREVASLPDPQFHGLRSVPSPEVPPRRRRFPEYLGTDPRSPAGTLRGAMPLRKRVAPHWTVVHRPERAAPHWMVIHSPVRAHLLRTISLGPSRPQEATLLRIAPPIRSAALEQGPSQVDWPHRLRLERTGEPIVRPSLRLHEILQTLQPDHPCPPWWRGTSPWNRTMGAGMVMRRAMAAAAAIPGTVAPSGTILPQPRRHTVRIGRNPRRVG